MRGVTWSLRGLGGHFRSVWGHFRSWGFLGGGGFCFKRDCGTEPEAGEGREAEEAGLQWKGWREKRRATGWGHVVGEEGLGLSRGAFPVGMGHFRSWGIVLFCFWGGGGGVGFWGGGTFGSGPEVGIGGEAEGAGLQPGGVDRVAGNEGRCGLGHVVGEGDWGFLVGHFRSVCGHFRS